MATTPKDAIKKTFAVINPATGEESGRYPLMDAADVDAAIKRAREAFPKWSASTHKQRRKILKTAAGLLADNARHYAELIASETGKTVFDAMLAEIATVCDVLTMYASNAEKYLKPEKADSNFLLPGRRGYLIYEPKGVVAIISPWNYPFTLSAGPVISAIAAGNTVVLKPSSQTTMSGIMVQEILEKAGLPKGVVEVVTGSGSITGQALIEHPDPDMLFFTGSTDIGRRVYMKAAERLKPVIMELGGKDPAIVTKNADLDRAAHAIAWGAFTNCGQTCIGMEIALVERPVYDEFMEKIVAITKNIRSGAVEGQVGSMTMADQLKIVEDQVADARAGGAKILTGGERPQGKGMFYPPTLMENVGLNMKVMTDETFGPLLPVVPYDDIDEAIRIANSGKYGLSSSVFSRDMDEARSIARRIKAGSVNINDCLVTFGMASLPFGGVKDSGVGRYHGKMGIQAFTNVKSITEFDWEMSREPYHYPMPAGIEKTLEAALTALFSRSPIKRMTSTFKALPLIRSMIRKSKE